MNYLGKANASDLEELIPLLDDVFFSESENPRMRFNTILPKLYKPEYSPCENNVIVRDGGDIKAAIGLYYDTVYSAGKVKAKAAGTAVITCRSTSSLPFL